MDRVIVIIESTTLFEVSETKRHTEALETRCGCETCWKLLGRAPGCPSETALGRPPGTLVGFLLSGDPKIPATQESSRARRELQMDQTVILTTNLSSKHHLDTSTANPR